MTKTPPAKAAADKTSPKAKPDITATGRNRTTQHVDAKRLGKY